MGNFRDLTNRMQLFEENHSKVFLQEKHEEILKLYQELYEELYDFLKDTTVNIKIGEYDVSIFITSTKGLYISEFDVILNKLIILADMKNIKLLNSKVVLELWFRCWEYREIQE